MEDEADAAAAAAKVVRGLGNIRAKNTFAHLRKIAQHPLLVRRLFTDRHVDVIAKLAHARFVLGFQMFNFQSAVSFQSVGSSRHVA